MTLILDLPDEQEPTLISRARASGVSAEQYAQQVLKRDLDCAGEQSVAAMFGEIWRDMPDDVRAKRPLDGPEQIDHYVYGVPKIET